MSVGRPRAARLLVTFLLSAAALAPSARAGADPGPVQAGSHDADVESTPRLPRVAMSVVSGVPCPPSLREVVSGQLAELTSEVVWACGDRFDPEEVFRPDDERAGVVRVFVDLRAGREALSGWAEAGYRLPVSYRAQPVGVRLDAASLRLGIALGWNGARRVSFTAGAGVGVGRVWFAPIGAAASVAPAATDAFWSGTARLWLAAELRVTPTLALAARRACDVAAADVHYDVHDASGTPHRVLTERRVAPGLGVGIAWRL